jgi:hypothetical protein
MSNDGQYVPAAHVVGRPHDDKLNRRDLTHTTHTGHPRTARQKAKQARTLSTWRFAGMLVSFPRWSCCTTIKFWDAHESRCGVSTAHHSQKSISTVPQRHERMEGLRNLSQAVGINREGG